jgi:PKD repeat protein
VAAVLGLVGLAAAGPAEAVQTAQTSIVSDDPVGFTPHVLDGEVDAIAQVGNLIVLGGSFTRVRNANDTTEIARRNLVAFDATTGLISQTFNPSPDDVVAALIPAPDGLSVYVGGAFNTISGVTRRKVAQLRVADGSVVTSFRNVAANGKVNDLRLVGTRLWVAGQFTTIAGQTRTALATLSATTGVYDPYLGLTVDGVHNGGSTSVMKIDVTPDGSKLVGIGNFSSVSGSTANQIFMLDLTGSAAALAPWRTAFYAGACSSSFTSYMRDLDISPDGTYMVVSTTGAYRGTTSSCDTTARFDLGRTGTAVVPEWINYTGGDTTYAVAITGEAVYVGGHQRWQNNPFAGDRAGAGAVARQGIAALDPVNGLPLRWNPGRSRGVGVFDMLATPTGLWVGSDTDRIGNEEYHGRIAFFRLAGGTDMPTISSPTLPGAVVTLAPASTPGTSPVLFRVNAGGPSLAAVDGGPAWSADTANTSAFRNNGSTSSTYPSGTTTVGVPGSTPNAVFDSVRSDGPANPEMQWRFTVPAGVPVQVRLYVVNRASATASPGQRVFDVSLDGALVLDDYDVVADVGTGTGTMKAFDVVSDGTVNIDFGHVLDNPMVSGIEIVRTDIAAQTGPRVVRSTSFTGSSVLGAADTTGDLSWAGLRGAFMINGVVYQAWSDGSFVRRSFDGTTWGAPTAVNTSDLLTPLVAWHTSVSRMTGLFYDRGRVYYTQTSDSTLRMRYLTTESDVVGAQEFAVQSSIPGVDLTTVRGMFLASGWLYLVRTDGSLTRVQWSDGAMVAGTVSTVSGPAVDGVSWTGAASFVFQSADGSGVNFPPTARSSVTCQNQQCAFSSAGSEDVGGSIVGYRWSFGDGATSTDAEATHTYAASGTYEVTLTVTDDRGATGTVVKQVPVTFVDAAPVAAFTQSCTGRVCSFDASTSSDAEGPLQSYAWDLGDGTAATGAAVQRTYAADGTYTVGLTVTDGAGQVATTTEPVTVAYVYSDPVAAFTPSCTNLACTFDGSASSDADGPVAAWAWDLGDGTSAAGSVVSHTYGAAGSYPVVLTVTDGEGRTASTTTTVTVTAPPVSGITAVDGRSVNANASRFALQVPTTAQAGDVMVLVLSANTAGVTVGDPAGWTLVDGASSASGVVGRIWTRVVGVGDPGTTVAVTTSVLVKADLSLLTYRGVNQAAPVAASAIGFETVSRPTHTTPAVAGVAGGRLVSYWGEKSSATTTLALPAGVDLRSSSTGTGSGRMTAAAGDSGPLGAGQTGGQTATADSASAKAFLASIVLAPAS